jgi:hypothetical protein
VQDIDVGQLVHGQPTPDPEIDTAVLSQKQGPATEKQGSALSA